MTITYLDDHRFNNLLDNIAGIVLAHVDNDPIDLHAFDVDLAEALLSFGIWPVSWISLMTQDVRQSLVTRIAEARGHLQP